MSNTTQTTTWNGMGWPPVGVTVYGRMEGSSKFHEGYVLEYRSHPRGKVAVFITNEGYPKTLIGWCFDFYPTPNGQSMEEDMEDTDHMYKEEPTSSSSEIDQLIRAKKQVELARQAYEEKLSEVQQKLGGHFTIKDEQPMMKDEAIERAEMKAILEITRSKDEHDGDQEAIEGLVCGAVFDFIDRLGYRDVIAAAREATGHDMTNH